MLVGVAIGTIATPYPAAAAAYGGDSSSGRSGMTRRLDARAPRAGEEALGPVGEHRVQVGEQHEGRGGAVRRRQLEDVARA